MSEAEEPGSDKVTARTRAFEEIDAQVFAGPGRGATQSEAAASDCWGRPSSAIVEAYRRMFDVVTQHSERLTQRVRGTPAPPETGIRWRSTTVTMRSMKPQSSNGSTSRPPRQRQRQRPTPERGTSSEQHGRGIQSTHGGCDQLSATSYRKEQ